MGCSAAKNLAVEPLDGNKLGSISNGNGVRKVSIPSAVPPLEGEDLQVEMLESATVNNVQKGPNGLSFEIAFEEGRKEEESIIKKHPPRRFQRLEDPPTSPITLDKLQEKLEEAEIRRQQILAQRVQSAKYRHQLKKQSSVGSSPREDDPDHLKIPTEDPPRTPNPYDVSYI